MPKTKIGNMRDFPEGGMKELNLDGKVLMVANDQGHLYAVEGRCSHMGFPLSKGKMSGKQVTCKMHGAIFDLETGKVLANPQAKDLKAYPVIIDGNEVYIDV